MLIPAAGNTTPKRALPHKFAARKIRARHTQAVIRIETDSAEGNERAAAELARRLDPGDVVLVSGELGSGKTTFVRGACRALVVTDAVTSPTFTIGQVYGGDGAGAEVAHLDLYR